MKNLVLSILLITVFAATAKAEPRAVLSEAQVKAIAVTQVRALFVKDDVLSLVSYSLEPVYSVTSIQHLGYDVYQVNVRRMQPGQTCQQNIVLNDSTGAVDSKQSPSCE